jgi:2-polyprenyl-6-methoxyphenol hydroxylase-like FAD-dependent oxidoreductase
VSPDLDVAIVGFGVAGAAVGCMLGGHGARIGAFERRDLERDPNRGDALHRGAVDCLASRGADAALERRGAFWLEQLDVVDGRSGRTVAELTSGRSALLMLAHAEIEAALGEVAAAREVAVRRSAVRSVARVRAGWQLDTDEGSVTARLVIGADGGSSVVRAASGIGTSGSDYKQATIVVHARRPSWLGERSGRAVLHPDGAVLVLPTTPVGRCRVAILVPRQEVAGWMTSPDEAFLDRLAARCASFGALELDRSKAHVYRLRRQHSDRYVDRDLALVGDAAHVTHPNGGQGMTMAVLDADCLSREVADPLRSGAGGAEMLAALRRYERQRRTPNARAIRRAHLLSHAEREGELAYRVAVAGLSGVARIPPALRAFSRRFGT